MKDYSQILRNPQQNTQRNQSVQRNQRQNQSFQSEQMTGSASTGQQGVSKVARRTLANTLGSSAEAAKSLGIPKRVAHTIVNEAYRGGGSQ